MASFTGSYKDFEKFIGPRLRNVVQSKIARKYKKSKGECEHCKAKGTLEAAHVTGKNRGWHIQNCCKKYQSGNQLLNVDLVAFETDFINSHMPPQAHFKILCKACHRIYDNVSGKIGNARLTSNTTAVGSLLNFTFYPSDVDEFKESLLLHKSALVTIHYNDGSRVNKEWNAIKFNANSDVLNNLRSRKEFRQGNWQKNNISHVEVEINKL